MIRRYVMMLLGRVALAAGLGVAGNSRERVVRLSPPCASILEVVSDGRE